MSWKAVYYRYYRRCEEECESFEEAAEFLRAGEDYGSLSSDAIVDPSGAVVWDRNSPTPPGHKYGPTIWDLFDDHDKFVGLARLTTVNSGQTPENRPG